MPVIFDQATITEAKTVTEKNQYLQEFPKLIDSLNAPIPRLNSLAAAEEITRGGQIKCPNQLLMSV
jgi:hypothetical protein